MGQMKVLHTVIKCPVRGWAMLVCGRFSRGECSPKKVWLSAKGDIKKIGATAHAVPPLFHARGRCLSPLSLYVDLI